MSDYKEPTSNMGLVVEGKSSLGMDMQKLEHGCRINHDARPPSLGLGFQDSHAPTFLLLLYPKQAQTKRGELQTRPA